MASILLIDSENTVRNVVTRILEGKGGHSVRATGDFNEALSWIREWQPQLVLTNVFLRGITGHDAMRTLRDEFPGLPVLMVSGLPDDEAIQEWIGETRFDVFPKPFTSNLLLDKVNRMIA